jgi:type 1 glutamine amidotransferase
MTARIDAYLVAGGKYHDVDFARLQLLNLLAEHEQVRVRVAADYEDTDAIARCQFLVSYTCDVRPSEPAQQAIRAWVAGGGRWLALHGTNAALDLPRPNGVEAPRCFPLWANTLGSQFVAHPPIMPYLVEITDPAHWLVAGLEPFTTDDELYASEYHDRDQLHALMHTTWTGEAKGFAEADWTSGDGQHLVMYVRPLGDGAVLYNTLGHCRSHYDMAPMVAYYPKIERGSWDVPQYHELLRRGLRWAQGLDA